MILDREFVEAFKTEARRQEVFTNSFWRQLAVILVAIAIINWVGPKIILYGTNITANWGGMPF
ncbi:hypothetical protein A3K24_00020 [candidate division Kazan bacterium RIFCSPHIGHO2_01_FULL_44_14]|uniref:Uncharacterized protein n=1 Tax=candidate division Kazan bacterium RIFCSPLOWO2_01_FULL_45_19 TaxID=1798538 RepID=A0A1F4NP70_UNCK3|nr:MAG: hypothetical protein A3K51_00020 [candidate division Kazan bacterium RIFCSPLOWO2_01_FULL_45_19]OGB77500.1 MAG: hypothetical protein A3K24_00020 [candidate division Kazan bacterium RIFCSPHIGHO2_01_FULL_44_14]